jgi:hypothetical protein
MGAGNSGKVECRVDPKAARLMAIALEMGMPHSIFIDLAEREYSPLVDTIWPSSHIALLKPF